MYLESLYFFKYFDYKREIWSPVSETFAVLAVTTQVALDIIRLQLTVI